MYYPNGTFDGYGNMPNSNFYQSAYLQQNPNYNMPVNQNALTGEEIQQLINSRPSGEELNLEISKDDVLRSYCCHCDQNGRDVVVQCNDGSGKVFCPICGERWNASIEYTKEDVEELASKLNDIFQNDKWVGNIPSNAVRGFAPAYKFVEETMAPIHNYATKNLKRTFGQNPYVNPNDANVYNQYNSLFNGNQFGAPQYYNNPMNPYANTQPMNYYGNQIPVQNPGYNPMQAQNPQQGYYPGYNPQFNQQAANMMPGYQAIPQQPIMPQQQQNQNPYAAAPQNNQQLIIPQQQNQAPQQQNPVGGYTPVYGVPQPQHNNQQAQPKEESSSAIYQL